MNQIGGSPKAFVPRIEKFALLSDARRVWPPATSTVSFGSTVAVADSRAVFNIPTCFYRCNA